MLKPHSSHESQQASQQAPLLSYAQQTEQEVLSLLGVSPQGLSSEEAQKRLTQYGHNRPAHRERRAAIVQFLGKFVNPFVIMLLVIALFSFFAAERVSAIFVIVMILISVTLDFVQEYRSELAVEKLNRLVRSSTTVCRNGASHAIDIHDIVPGDIVELSAGNMIPADMRLLSCKELFINQSSLTGESFPVEKSSEALATKDASITAFNNLAFMGSSVVSGSARGVVIKTGIWTQFGQISKSLAQSETPSSFDIGIRKFTMLMIRIIVLFVIFIMLVLSVVKQAPFRDALLFSLAVAVGLAPEMLPMLVTLNLSRGAIVMSRKKVIVKHLNAIQAFGAMDIVCTDKTGTLTRDEIVLERHCDIDGTEDEDVLKYAYTISHYQTGLKNVLDKAILKHEKVNINAYQKVDEIPFDFFRRVMSVVVRSDGSHLLYSKGAPEEIFRRCVSYEHEGKILPIDAAALEKLSKLYDDLSREGFRVLAVAYKQYPATHAAYSKEDEKEMTLRGYVGFLDPAKPSTKETLTALQELGIEIKILTGDNELVTRKICADVQLGIKGLLSGDRLDEISDEALQTLVEKTTVFVRLSPSQKERVIKMLRKNKHIVGYMGDGINDAPSLKAADVGISVNNAVDIAKESADIILLEKELMVLREGVVEGRKTFGNLTKYIKMGASSNFGNMLSMTGATLFIPFLPMMPIQILLNNMLYEVSNLAVPSDEMDQDYLSKPRPWNVDYIRKFMLFIGPCSSVFDFLTYALMWFVFGASTLDPAAQALFRTGWFVESICSQTLVIHVIRTNKIPFIQSRPSRLLMITTLLIVAAAIALPFTPLAPVFKFVPLPPLYFAFLGGILVAYLGTVHMVKTWMVKRFSYV